LAKIRLPDNGLERRWAGGRIREALDGRGSRILVVRRRQDDLATACGITADPVLDGRRQACDMSRNDWMCAH
jgi:hypothetical protein